MRKKDCAYLIAVLLAGVVFGAVGAIAVLGDMSFSISLKDMLQTIGALLSGLGASYAAYIAVTIARQDRERRRQSALKYLLAEISTFYNFKSVMDVAFRDEFSGLMGSDILEVEKSLKILQSINKERVMEASTAFGDLLLVTESRINSFLQTVHYINDIPFQYRPSSNIPKEIKANATAMNRAVNELFYKNENWESYLDVRNYE